MADASHDPPHAFLRVVSGVGLDRGELDMLLDRAAEEVADPRYDDDRRDHDHVPPSPFGGYSEPRHDPRNDPKYRNKKKSFLSEFLDFD